MVRRGKNVRDESVRRRGYAAIARDLVEFGYPDVTPEMIREIDEAYRRGDAKMPHGVIGLIVKSGFDKAAARGEERA